MADTVRKGVGKRVILWNWGKLGVSTKQSQIPHSYVSLCVIALKLFFRNCKMISTTTRCCMVLCTCICIGQWSVWNMSWIDTNYIQKFYKQLIRVLIKYKIWNVTCRSVQHCILLLSASLLDSLGLFIMIRNCSLCCTLERTSISSTKCVILVIHLIVCVFKNRHSITNKVKCVLIDWNAYCISRMSNWYWE